MVVTKMSDNFPDLIKMIYLLRCLDLQVIKMIQAIQVTGRHVGWVSKEIEQSRWHLLTMVLIVSMKAAKTVIAAKEVPKTSFSQ